jgi:hypothetical protein
VPKRIEDPEGNGEIITLLSSYCHITVDAASLYLLALEKGTIIQEQSNTKAIKELASKDLLYEPVKGTEVYLPKAPAEQLLPEIFKKIDEIQMVCDEARRQRDKSKQNQAGTILKILEGQDAVDKAVFNLIKNSKPGYRIKLCVRSLSPLGDAKPTADAIKNNRLHVKALLISHATGSHYKEALERLKQLRSLGVQESLLEVRHLAERNEEFRYMITPNNVVVFVTGGREKGMFAEDSDVANWFEEIFDDDWNKAVPIVEEGTSPSFPTLKTGGDDTGSGNSGSGKSEGGKDNPKRWPYRGTKV